MCARMGNEMQYVVGLDGGGTKTQMQIIDMTGKIILTARAGSLNYNSVSKEELSNTIESLMNILCELPEGISNCKGICISTAGISNKEAIEFITENLVSRGLNCDIHIVGDHEAALYGAFGKPEGIVLISGTGSICFGMNREGIRHRTGGYGHLIDDEGSGYAIGRDILKVAVQTYDKRISDSVILDLVLKELNCNSIEDIIRYTYNPNWNKANIAALAPLLLKAMEEGDVHANHICKKAVDNLVNLVLPTAEILNLKEGNLALLGGILTHYIPIKEMLIQKLSMVLPTLKIITPLNDSVTGAAKIALNRYKLKN